MKKKEKAITSAFSQNGTPGLGLCHFIWEKNGMEALGAFTVNSYVY